MPLFWNVTGSDVTLVASQPPAMVPPMQGTPPDGVTSCGMPSGVVIVIVPPSKAHGVPVPVPDGASDTL